MILNNITNALVGTSEVKQICLGTYVIWQNGQPVVLYDVMCSGTISEYTGHAPSVWCYSTMKWYMRTVGGNYREYGIYAVGKPQDPYIGELASDDGHEWEYTASGWVDLGELTSRLPAGYTEVDYIDNVQTASSTTGAVIATDYTPYADTKIEYKMQNLSNGQQYPRFFGCGEWNGSNGYQMDYENYKSNPTLHISFLGVAGWTTNYDIVDDLQPHEYVWDKNNFYYEGTLACTSTYNASLVSVGNMYIFNCQNSNTTNLWMKGRMFYFRVYDDNVLVRDYVPCRRESDGKVGVYDVVNDTFLLSCNNYLFYAGPDTQEQSYPVEYDFKGEPDIEGMDYKVMITGSIEDYTGSEGKVYVIPEEKWYIRTIGGNYTEYGIYAKGKPEDPYIGELASDDGHEWEYTASGWVDLGEGGTVITTQYFLAKVSGADYSYELPYHWNNSYKMVIDLYCSGTYISDNGAILGHGGINGLFEFNAYNNGFYLDFHAPTSTSEPTTYTGDYSDRNMQSGLSAIPKDGTRLLVEIQAATGVKIYNYETGVQLHNSGQISTSYNYCTTGLYKSYIRSANINPYAIHGIKIYDDSGNLINDFNVYKRDKESGADMFYVKDNVVGTIIENTGSSTTIPYGTKEGSEAKYPKEYEEMEAPEPIDTFYETAADEYLKSNDNYYCKDYIDNLYQCGAYEQSSEYVQGDQLTPTYVQGQESDFVVYEGGRYYKNYIYVQPVDQQLATGDYVRGEYIGPADILFSGTTSSSNGFTVKINNVDTTAYITGQDGNLYTWTVYGDASQTITSLYEFARSNSNIKTCHMLIDGTNVSNTQYMLQYCSNLASVTLPNGLESINISAFFYCRSLASITIPNTVTSIGEAAFQSCASLASITIPSSVTSIGGGAFSYCSSLTTVSIGSGLSSLSPSSFNTCSNLTTITVDANNATYDSRDNCNAIIKTSTNELVCGCKNTVIPNTVTSIGTNAFYRMNVVSMNIPNSVTSIGSQAFRENTTLESITFGSGLTTIDSFAFRDCSSLKEVIIPSSVTSIGGDAFYGCTNTVFHIQAITPPTLRTNVFDKGYGIIYVPVGTAETYKAASGWSNYASRIYEEGETFSTAQVKGTAVNNGNIVYLYFNASTPQYYAEAISYNQDGTFNFICEPPANATSIGSGVGGNSGYYYSDDIVTIDFSGMPSTCVTLNKQTFRERKNLVSVVLPSSLTSIKDTQFYGSKKLVSLNIPEGVTSIDGSFASGCSSLTNVTLPSTLTAISNSMFYDCTNLASVNIPNSVNTIGATAFYNCRSLTSIVIPDTVTAIKDAAFMYCTSLESITIGSDVTSIGSQAFRYCTSTVFHVKATTPPTIISNSFHDTYGIIYVPVGTAETYKAASVWSNYARRIYEEGTDFSTAPVKCTVLSGNPGQIKYYSNGTLYRENLLPVSPGNAVLLPSHTIDRLGNGGSDGGLYNTAILSIDFSNCTTLTNVRDWSFYYCSNLDKIILPSSVTKAAYSMVNMNGTVDALVILATTPPIKEFNSSTQLVENIYVPDAVVETYKTDTYWSNDAAKIKPLSELPS